MEEQFSAEDLKQLLLILLLLCSPHVILSICFQLDTQCLIVSATEHNGRCTCK